MLASTAPGATRVANRIPLPGRSVQPSGTVQVGPSASIVTEASQVRNAGSAASTAATGPINLNVQYAPGLGSATTAPSRRCGVSGVCVPVIPPANGGRTANGGLPPANGGGEAASGTPFSSGPSPD